VCIGTSGVILAKDPLQKLEEMIAAMRKAWDEIHDTGA
jgi:energy-converting hydrogenase Eha subunit C